MNRTQILQLLTEHKPVLAQCLGVLRLALFGSVVRDAAKEGSDVDVLVAFDGPATSARYFGVHSVRGWSLPVWWRARCA